MDAVLYKINGDFISPSEVEIARNKKILESVLKIFIEKMKTKDRLFAHMFRRVFYGGGVYDGLAVSKTEEFDLDLLLDVPVLCAPKLYESDTPGFVQLQITDLDKWLKQPEANDRFEAELLDGARFLSSSKVKSWMQSIIYRCLNDFGGMIQTEEGTFPITSTTESGPAWTLHIPGSDFKINIDLVACFVFGADKWPTGGIRSNLVSHLREEFFIVPKQPRQAGYEPPERYWRLSFQEQERELIKGKEKLKPAIRLIKKMRDTCNHKPIASYYIKTVFLHLLDRYGDAFWNRPLRVVFMTTLNGYAEFIEARNIPYYWDHSYNLIGHLNAATAANISGQLLRIIRDVESHEDEPDRIARHILSDEEFPKFVGQNNVTRVEHEPQFVPWGQTGTEMFSERNQVQEETQMEPQGLARNLLIGAGVAAGALALGFFLTRPSRRD